MKTLNSKPLHDIFSKKKESIKKDEEKIKIIVDYREKNSLVASYLVKNNFDIEFTELKIGDYIVKGMVIERKTVADFIGSMMNGRLINQIENLKMCEDKLLLIEGISERELYTEENPKINPNAIRSFLLSIILKHKIPIIFTKNSEDSAKFISVLSKKKNKEAPLNMQKKTLDKNQQLQFILESFPGIGPKKSKELLKKFGTIQNIFNASAENLKEILGKGANSFIEIINRKY